MRHVLKEARRTAVALTAAAVVASGLLAGALPASAAGGLAPDNWDTQNLPANGSCGSNGEEWVKFTTGGTVTTGSNEATPTGGYKWSATYSTGNGELTIASVTDAAGNPIYFNSVIGGAGKDNPQWKFATAASSPLLAVLKSDGSVNKDNFSQFAICALPVPYVSGSVTKVVEGSSADPAATFTVAIDCHTVLSGGGLGPDNLADPRTVTLTAGQTASFLAPLGSKCTFTEPTIPDGYELVSIQPASLTMASGSAVTVTNRVATKTLTVNKAAEGGDGTFAFTVNCTNPDSSTPLSVTTKDGSGSGTVVVPSTATCTVSETVPDGWSLSGSADARSFENNAASFTNLKDGSLAITKTAVGGPDGAEFVISYTCTDGTKGSVTLASGGSETVNGIAGGATCTVSESNDNYTAAFEPAAGEVTVAAGGTATVAVTNTRKTTSLTINKTAKGGDGTFTFDVTCSGGGESFSKSGVSVTTTSGSGSVTVDGIPTGLDCTVTETNIPAGYTVDAAEKSVAAGGSVAFTNTGTGSLAITKTVVGGPDGAEFVISYTCTDGTKGSVTLASGGSETVNGIAGGATCTVSESNDNYTATFDPATGEAVIVTGGTATVAVTNTRKTTSLTINKTAKGGDGTFTFDVTCSGGGESFSKSGVSVTTTSGSGSVTVDGIPTGLDCTVTEAANDQWLADSLTQSAAVGATGGTVAFVNTKLEKVTLVKFYDANANGKQDAGEPGIAGWQITLGGKVYTTGSDGSVTATVPAGSYTALEGSAAGWVHVTPNSVSLTAPGTASFGNVCLGSGNFHTIGWWQNKNGQALIDTNDLAALRALPLVNADGSAFDPTSAAAVKTWMQAAKATNMAYMLSAQLASTKLSLLNGFGSGSALVYAPEVKGADANGFITADALIAEATAALAADGNTPANDPNRVYQAVLVQALTALNNGTNVLQSTPCATPGTFTF